MAVSKSSPGKSAAKDAAPVGAAAAPVATGDDAAVPAKAEMIKMKDFMARVSTRLEGKKKSARDVVEATLAALGETLKAGENFNLPTLGRGRVVKSADGVVTLKLRQGPVVKATDETPKEALAATED